MIKCPVMKQNLLQFVLEQPTECSRDAKLWEKVPVRVKLLANLLRTTWKGASWWVHSTCSEPRGWTEWAVAENTNWHSKCVRWPWRPNNNSIETRAALPIYQSQRPKIVSRELSLSFTHPQKSCPRIEFGFYWQTPTWSGGLASGAAHLISASRELSRLRQRRSAV